MVKFGLLKPDFHQPCIGLVSYILFYGSCSPAETSIRMRVVQAMLVFEMDVVEEPSHLEQYIKYCN